MNKYRHHPQFIVKPMPSDQQMHLPISVYILDITVTSQNNVSDQANKQKHDTLKTMKTKATYNYILKMYNF